MICGFASLLKLWITVALSASALVATVEVDSTLSPFKVNSERNLAVLAPFSHPYYPSGLVRDQPIPSNDEVVYVDEGPSSKDEETEQLKRSMGMLRLGRASSLDKRARTMAALRLGRRSLPAAAAASAAQSDDWQSASDSWKRTMGMLRLGRRSDAAEDDEDQNEEQDEEEEKRSMGMLRLGRNSRQHQLQSEDSAAAGDKRSMGMLRLGRSAMRRMLSR